MKAFWDYINRGEPKWLAVLAVIAVIALLYLFLSRGSSETPLPVADERPVHTAKPAPASPVSLDTNLDLGWAESPVEDQRSAKRIPSREELREEFDRRYEEMQEVMTRDATIVQ